MKRLFKQVLQYFIYKESVVIQDRQVHQLPLRYSFIKVVENNMYIIWKVIELEECGIIKFINFQADTDTL